MFRGDLGQELAWYHPHGAAIIQAFVDGINAYVEETERHPELLTPEFKMLGIAPGKWTPAVVISRFNGLMANINEELNIALAVRTLGIEKVKDLYYFQPANPSWRSTRPSTYPCSRGISWNSIPHSSSPLGLRRMNW